ncbi:MAG TPA: hypothetical protein VLM75_14465 [Spirochaetota bacterium]|nr:hypothetical protein [Spirochaetota bacterium]
MNKTRHASKRVRQRGISERMIDLAFICGRDERDRVILDRRGLHRLIGEVDDLRRLLLRTLDKGGIVVVERDGVLITAFPKNT